MLAKICGITSLKDALFCAKLGAWAIGFNFYPNSPRYIHPTDAKLIMDKMPKSIIKIGIFIHQENNTIQDTVEALSLDFAQVYDAYLQGSPKTILALQANSLDELPHEKILAQHAYILLDAPPSSDGKLGGTGRTGNWAIAAELAKKYRLILAGGLQPNNIQQAITAVNPFAVDVASGIESSPGKKDLLLLQNFIQKVNNHVE